MKKVKKLLLAFIVMSAINLIFAYGKVNAAHTLLKNSGSTLGSMLEVVNQGKVADATHSFSFSVNDNTRYEYWGYNGKIINGAIHPTSDSYSGNCGLYVYDCGTYNGKNIIVKCTFYWKPLTVNGTKIYPAIWPELSPTLEALGFCFVTSGYGVKYEILDESLQPMPVNMSLTLGDIDACQYFGFKTNNGSLNKIQCRDDCKVYYRDYDIYRWFYADTYYDADTPDLSVRLELNNCSSFDIWYGSDNDNRSFYNLDRYKYADASKDSDIVYHQNRLASEFANNTFVRGSNGWGYTNGKAYGPFDLSNPTKMVTDNDETKVVSNTIGKHDEFTYEIYQLVPMEDSTYYYNTFVMSDRIPDCLNYVSSKVYDGANKDVTSNFTITNNNGTLTAAAKATNSASFYTQTYCWKITVSFNSSVIAAVNSGYNWNFNSSTHTYTMNNAASTAITRSAGNATKSSNTVTTKYAMAPSYVDAVYVDKVTGETIETKVTKTGYEGENYSTSEKDIDGYVLDEVVGNEEGKYTEARITVTYKYLKQSNVITKFVDENTGKTIDQDTIITFTEGSPYLTNKKTINGYTYTRVNGTESGTVGREDITVTYYYKKNSAVTAKYIDKTTRQEIESQVRKTGLEGDNYTTEQKTITGYTYSSIDGNASGKLAVEETTVTYEYLKNADVITKFVDENTGESIEDDVVNHYKETDNYQTTKKTIDGYTFTRVEGNESGAVGRENITVTYYYKQNTGVITKHIDQVTKAEIADQDSQNGLVGQTYTTAAKDIDGYSLVKTPDNSTGKMTVQGIIVTYEYLKNTNVVTKHIDKVTKQEIADSVNVEGLEGQDYTTNSKVIEGYTLSVTPANKNGKMAATETVVTYEYLKNTSVTTKHIDSVTKEEIGPTTTRKGLEGDAYTTSGISISGYTLVVTPNNANGNMSADPITVTYEYLKNTGVVAKYVDQVTGEEIADVVPQTGLQGQDYVTAEKTIPGYELVKTPENKTGKFGAEQTTVTYEYRKLSDVVTRFIDENTNTEITAHVTNTYKEGDTYNTTKKDIAGYTYTKVEGNTTGTVERENIEVKYYYKKTAAGVVVNYVDQVTGAAVANAESFTGLEKDYYTTEPKEVEGYKLVVIPDNSEGEMTTDTITVTYEYLKIVKVTAKYVDLNTKEELAERTSNTYLQGDMYSTIRKNIEDYQYMFDSENVSGIMGDKDVEVTYYYRPISSGVVVKYVDKENDELLTEDTIAGLIGDKYTTTEFTFEDYNFVEVIGETEGTLQKDPIEVTYYYIKKRGTVTISYVDEEGNELYHEDLEDYVKEKWKHEEKEIYGYEVIERPEATEGIFIDGNIDVIFVLRRLKGTITVKFTDKVGNVLAEEHFSEDFVGEDFDFNAQEIEGYTIIENARIETQYIDGKMILTVVYDKIPETGDINVATLTLIFTISLVIVSRKIVIYRASK